MDKQKAMFEEIKKKIEENRKVQKQETIFSDLSEVRLTEICADVSKGRLGDGFPKLLIPYAQEICDTVNEPNDNRFTLQDGFDVVENELLMELINRRSA